MGRAKFTVDGEVAGHSVEIVTTAEADTEHAEKEAEKIHMDLQARAQQLDEAVSSQATHPDDVQPSFGVAWDRVLGLEDDDSEIVLYGYSDDLIEVDGDARAEFTAEYDAKTLLALSDGTVVGFEYDGEWKATVESVGDAASVSITPPDGDDRPEQVSDYSDAVVVETTGVEWVLKASELHREGGA